MIKIKKIIIFFSLLIVSSCFSYRNEVELANKDNYIYTIQYPKEKWDFFRGATDRSTYYDSYIKDYVETVAIITKEEFDAIIEIFILDKKNDKSCILQGNTFKDYDESNLKKTSKVVFNKDKIFISRNLLNKWHNDNNENLLRVYFGLDAKSCILFTLQNKPRNKKKIGNTFYNVIKSLHRKR
jgi:hypothetical protein